MREHEIDTSGTKPNRTKSPTIEWIVAEDDHQWRCAQTPATLPSSASNRRSWRWWLLAVGPLFAIIMIGGWLWHQAQIGLTKIEEELQVAVAADQWRAQQDSPTESIHTAVIQDMTGGDQLPGITDIRLIDLQKDWALVQVIWGQDAYSYRQTRIYRSGVGGWYASPPREALWGTQHTLETAHFVFHYFALDAAAVTEAAMMLDAFYPDLVAIYPLERSSDDKHQVWVSPENSILGHYNASVGTELHVASPAIYLAPTFLSEGDILAQAVLLRLLEALATQTLESQFSDRSHDYQAMSRVTALLKSLNLWQVWSAELPLSLLHKPTIQWVYRHTQQRHASTGFDADLCPLHQLWKAAPNAIQIPIFCGDPQRVTRYEVGRYLPSTPPRSLADIHLFAPMTPDEPARGLIEAEYLGLATLFDYTAAVYGPQSLSTLVANVATHTSWETLILATFGVSYAEFETGWQAHLNNHYAISDNDLR